MPPAPPAPLVPPRTLQGVTLVCLCVFLLGHVVALLVSLPLPAQAPFDDYNKAAEIFTHLFALPALLRARHLREQILVATVVSIVYHSVRNYAEWTAEDVLPLQRLDHGTSTALIATVFLKFICRTQHVTGTIVLVAAVAAAFVEVGNLLSSAVVGAILVLVLVTPCVSTAAFRVVNACIYIISFGAHASDPSDLRLHTEKPSLAIAFVLQALSVGAFFAGENVEGVERWSHALWHVFAYLSLYVLVGIIARREDSGPVPDAGANNARVSRKDFYDFVRQKRHLDPRPYTLLRGANPVD